MKPALAVAMAEIRRHRIVLVAGLMLGALPLALHLLFTGEMLRPPRTGQLAPLAHLGVWVTAGVLSFAVALGLGASGVARDLGERRLGFWLARPLPLLSYWLGKLSAAWILALLAGLLALLPAIALGGIERLDSLRQLSRVGDEWALALLGLVAVASTVASAFRARSGLILVDVLMAPLLVAAVWFALNRAFEGGGLWMLLQTLRLWLALAAAAIVVANAVQICAGRLDLRRGHLWLSGIAWGGLFASLAGGPLVATAAVRATSADRILEASLEVYAPRNGGRVVIAGSAAGSTIDYSIAFLLDERGNTSSLGGVETWSGLAWSADGSRLALGRKVPFEQGAPVPEPELIEIHEPGSGQPPIRHRRGGWLIALSPTGRRALLHAEHGYEVVDTQTGRSLARVVDDSSWRIAAFVSESLIRGLAHPDRSRAVDVIEWRFEGDRPPSRSALPPPPAPRRTGWFDRFYLDARPTFVRQNEEGATVHAMDGRTLATLAGPGNRGWVVPLSGDRWGFLAAQSAELHVFDAHGLRLRTIALPRTADESVGGWRTSEPRAGLLAIPLYGTNVSPRQRERRTLLLDLDTGRIERELVGLEPAGRRWGEPAEPGSLATRLMLTNEELVLLEPDSGRTRLLTRLATRYEEP